MSNTTKRVLIIASVCHALNAALQVAAGETEIVDWNHAPDEIKQSAIAGVNYHLENPSVTPEQSHEAWLKHRADNGWVYGEIKNVEAKVHPCMVPFAELPFKDQVKDHIFRATVHALKDLPLEGLQSAAAALADPVIAPPVPIAVPRGFMPITYIGKRETYKDGMFGTGLTFARGQTLPVPAAAGAKMLGHPDVYVLGKIEQTPMAPAADTAAADKAALDAQAEKDRLEELQQDNRDAVSRMKSKAAVVEFVRVNFNQPVDGRLSLDDLKAKATQLIDQFGVPG